MPTHADNSTHQDVAGVAPAHTQSFVLGIVPCTRAEGDARADGEGKGGMCEKETRGRDTCERKTYSKERQGGMYEREREREREREAHGKDSYERETRNSERQGGMCERETRGRDTHAREIHGIDTHHRDTQHRDTRERHTYDRDTHGDTNDRETHAPPPTRDDEDGKFGIKNLVRRQRGGGGGERGV